MCIMNSPRCGREHLPNLGMQRSLLEHLEGLVFHRTQFSKCSATKWCPPMELSRLEPFSSHVTWPPSPSLRKGLPSWVHLMVLPSCHHSCQTSPHLLVRPYPNFSPSLSWAGMTEWLRAMRMPRISANATPSRDRWGAPGCLSQLDIQLLTSTMVMI